MSEKEKPKAVVVGGSIAGVSCAHALISAGWEVVVLEKSCAPTAATRTATGAGLGLDPLALGLIQSWLGRPELLQNSTLPLTVDLNQATDSEKKVSQMLTRDENFNFRAALWADLHRLLYNSLPANIFLWGHLFLSLYISDDKTYVKIKAKVLQTGKTVEIVANLLVAADGSLSSIRQSFFPEFKLRYSGYCAWRGVLDFSGNENSDTVLAIRRAYPELGKCLYFDLGPGTHCVLYELPDRRLNWLWNPSKRMFHMIREKQTNIQHPMFHLPSHPRLQTQHLTDQNQAITFKPTANQIQRTNNPRSSQQLQFHQPKDPGEGYAPCTGYRGSPHGRWERNSVTMKVSSEMVQKMYQESENIWVPELVRVMKETKDPFLNFIYDGDPLEKFLVGKCGVSWGRSSPDNSSWAEKHEHVSVGCSSFRQMPCKVGSRKFTISFRRISDHSTSSHFQASSACQAIGSHQTRFSSSRS
ncbi:hypothetical protein CJ030_MR8G021784 [Morella rubra]|uniref:Uncharacterized protein n=1 Tax=Morella rubra TaxID=262757 RepID=A0A6A1UVV0_9ROSI|nr:hypothetical protein CJ030_MR8G021784 [Morella rubra]